MPRKSPISASISTALESWTIRALRSPSCHRLLFNATSTTCSRIEHNSSHSPSLGLTKTMPLDRRGLALGDDGLGAVLPYLQEAATPPLTRAALRKAHVGLDDVRKHCTELLDAPEPELVKLQRVTARSFLNLALFDVRRLHAHWHAGRYRLRFVLSRASRCELVVAGGRAPGRADAPRGQRVQRHGVTRTTIAARSDDAAAVRELLRQSRRSEFRWAYCHHDALLPTFRRPTRRRPFSRCHRLRVGTSRAARASSSRSCSSATSISVSR